MKQTVFMILLTLLGSVGAFGIRPFVGFAVYFLFAILRPQYMWYWALPSGVSWSFFVAMATIGALLITGSRPPPTEPGRCPAVRSRSSRSHVLFFAFAVTIVVSYVLARSQTVASMFMEEYAKLIIMYFVGLYCITTIGQLWKLFMIFTCALAYLAYEINIEYLTKGILWIYHNGYGGLDNNGAGLLMALAVPMCASAWEYYRKWYRWVFVLLIPVIIHAVLMTYSRGAMVSLIVACPVWVLRGRKRWQKIAAGCAVAACVPFLAGKEIQERFFSIEKAEEDASAQSRFTSWTVGLQIASDYPMFGIGVRNSSLVTFDYGADMVGRVIHSQYIQLAADCGFIGAGIYLALLGMTIWHYLKVSFVARRYDDEDSRKAYAISTGLLGALVTFAVGAVFLSLELFEPQYYLILFAPVLRTIYLGGISDSSAVQSQAVFAGVRVGPSTPATGEPNSQSPDRDAAN